MSTVPGRCGGGWANEPGTRRQKDDLLSGNALIGVILSRFDSLRHFIMSATEGGRGENAAVEKSRPPLF
ncbi:hypothetical protein GWI33_017550 [Rhynchophorus ferrugineus]|uniref:Uncharacterized protein n=1 Tax=Rhynchophorus ferrugineus TaxID=354439 RepID=A0A834M643_RHYFE|nr:hypothetical protein GWI33_017550 [Rhynchophorus ferrugineus]